LTPSHTSQGFAQLQPGCVVVDVGVIVDVLVEVLVECDVVLLPGKMTVVVDVMVPWSSSRSSSSAASFGVDADHARIDQARRRVHRGSRHHELRVGLAGDGDDAQIRARPIVDERPPPALNVASGVPSSRSASRHTHGAAGCGPARPRRACRPVGEARRRPSSPRRGTPAGCRPRRTSSRGVPSG
jgi:hypothetical protein